VRLSQGSAERETVYAEDPAEVAEAFAQAGARWIHLVDLDRALDQGSNDDAIRTVVERVGPRVRLQLGGGLRMPPSRWHRRTTWPSGWMRVTASWPCGGGPRRPPSGPSISHGESWSKGSVP